MTRTFIISSCLFFGIMSGVNASHVGSTPNTLTFALQQGEHIKDAVGTYEFSDHPLTVSCSSTRFDPRRCD